MRCRPRNIIILHAVQVPHLCHYAARHLEHWPLPRRLKEIRQQSCFHLPWFKLSTGTLHSSSTLHTLNYAATLAQLIPTPLWDEVSNRPPNRQILNYRIWLWRLEVGEMKRLLQPGYQFLCLHTPLSKAPFRLSWPDSYWFARPLTDLRSPVLNRLRICKKLSTQYSTREKEILPAHVSGSDPPRIELSALSQTVKSPMKYFFKFWFSHHF